MARTITLTEQNIQRVEAAYATYYGVATRSGPEAHSGHPVYENARRQLRLTIRQELGAGLTTPAKLEELSECLADNFGFPGTLPRILRHMGYDVDDSQAVYARTYKHARAQLEGAFPAVTTFGHSGIADYVLGRLDGTMSHVTDPRAAVAEAQAWLQASQDHADARRLAATSAR